MNDHTDANGTAPGQPAPSNRMTGAEAAVRMLQAHGVQHVFGLCGDTSLPFYDALYRLDHGIHHILARDERSAAYMADGYARVSGRVGICEGPSGGGATYILPGVVEANDSSVPMVAITSDVSVPARGRYPLTELDQEALFRPLTKWNAVVDHVDQIPAFFRTAFRAATTGRPGATHIGLPYDLQKLPLGDNAEIWAQSEHQGCPAFRVAGDPQMVRMAVDVILAAKSPVIVCGGGVCTSGATQELAMFARLLSIPVATTITGRGAVSDDFELSLGAVGTNGGSADTAEMLAIADLVIFIGCRAGSTTTEHWTVPGRATRIVHIDIDPMVIGCNYRCDAGVVGDARLVLAAMIAEVEARSNRGTERPEVASMLAALRERKRDRFLRQAASLERPIRPERVLAALQEVLPPDAVVVADPGTPCPYVTAHYLLARAGRHFITNRAQGALGYALSAAIGAWFGQPNSKCVAMMGDGSFGFTVGELETVVRHKVPLTMIVFSNSSFGWIKASQKDGYGSRYFSVDFGRTDHARIAEAYGIKAWHVEDPEQVGTAVREAVEWDGPTLVDIISQPIEETNVPVSKWMG